MKPFDETPFDIMSSNKSHLARNIIEQKVIVPKNQLTYFLRGGCCRPPRDCRWSPPSRIRTFRIHHAEASGCDRRSSKRSAGEGAGLVRRLAPPVDKLFVNCIISVTRCWNKIKWTKKKPQRFLLKRDVFKVAQKVNKYLGKGAQILP